MVEILSTAFNTVDWSCGWANAFDNSGLYLATVWFLAMFLLVDRNMLPTDALGSSRELVHELGFWKVFGVYMLTTFVIQILSVIPVLNILAIFTIPFMYTIYLAVYENTIKDSLTS